MAIISVEAFLNNYLELLSNAIRLQNKFLKNTATFIEVISMQSLPRFISNNEAKWSFTQRNKEDEGHKGLVCHAEERSI
jgi:hypothetical protein